jgi:hypothetical protein
MLAAGRSKLTEKSALERSMAAQFGLPPVKSTREGLAFLNMSAAPKRLMGDFDSRASLEQSVRGV